MWFRICRNEPDTKCVDVRVGRKRNLVNPPCWDYNDTVDSRTATCRLEDGTTKKYCMEFAFATNAFVVECRGDFETDMTCGTYVELHKQGACRAGDGVQLKVFFFFFFFR